VSAESYDFRINIMMVLFVVGVVGGGLAIMLTRISLRRVKWGAVILSALWIIGIVSWALRLPLWVSLIMVGLWVPIGLGVAALAKGFGEAMIGRKIDEDDYDKIE